MTSDDPTTVEVAAHVLWRQLGYTDGTPAPWAHTAAAAILEAVGVDPDAPLSLIAWHRRQERQP